jgi:hypothetical protein
MRVWLAAAAAALILAGCGQQGAGGGSNGAGAPAASTAFPNLAGASYRVEGVMHRPGASAGAPEMHMVQIRSGKLMRMEFSDPTSGMQSASIINGDTREAYTLTNMGGRQMAMRMSLDQAQNNSPAPNVDFDPASVTRGGPCSAAGETGTEWSRAFEGHTTTMCLTSDGIILKQSRDGTLYWETTSIQRGPQDPSLFVLPPGVQVMDMSAMANGMASRLQQMQQLREKAGQ